MNKTRVGIIGASGYTGLELVKLILQHPVFDLTYLATSEGETTIQELHPSLADVYHAEVEKANPSVVAHKCELVFLAVPHKTAMELVKPLMELDVKVVDLSADYRLQQSTYEAHYVPHTDPENLTHVVYGLPELFREELKQARLVANPGCYPTATILGALPFMEYRTPNTPIIVDAKSGVSGAGKKCVHNTHYVTINDNAFAYNPLGHRHGPEIAEKLNVSETEVSFVPHLLPLTRGMLSSVYLHVKDPIDPIAILETYYADEPMVRVRRAPVDMKSVAGTNFCDLYAKWDNGILFITSAIDNLLRGASSQAVVNANLMMGLEENCGIPTIAYVP